MQTLGHPVTVTVENVRLEFPSRLSSLVMHILHYISSFRVWTLVYRMEGLRAAAGLPAPVQVNQIPRAWSQVVLSGSQQHPLASKGDTKNFLLTPIKAFHQVRPSPQDGQISPLAWYLQLFVGSACVGLAFLYNGTYGQPMSSLKAKLDFDASWALGWPEDRKRWSLKGS